MKVLDFTIEQQKCSEWCWAAVASAVCFAYKDENALTQSEVVDRVLGAPTGSQCNCLQDSTVACNTPESLPFVLDVLEHSGDESPSMTFNEITDEIDAGRPIVVQVTMPDAAASMHAIALYGYGEVDTVLIADPMHAGDLITVSLEDLVAGTATGFHGTWQTAYKTVQS